ncbi:cyclin-dependent kinase inhibitor family protein [Striga asiatica]|uniref:Cyclin-dependent kinase inhibitor family protein n=1 Tax=Striga asiatica TaxID=4170 RepID=A0A5A7REE4_STRAF|nr:cyclin-dependent kinase inhibitor family protein [Striga asiatica]
MGKYIRKPKTSGDVAVKDASQSYLGVRTRAKTLALQRLRSSADASPPPKTDYLQLRSRRLQKPPLLRKNFPNSGKAPAPAAAADGKFGNSAEEPSSEPAALPVPPGGGEDGRFGRVNGGGSDNNDSEIKASVGDNNLEFEARDRCLLNEALDFFEHEVHETLDLVGPPLEVVDVESVDGDVAHAELVAIHEEGHEGQKSFPMAHALVKATCALVTTVSIKYKGHVIGDGAH